MRASESIIQTPAVANREGALKHGASEIEEQQKRPQKDINFCIKMMAHNDTLSEDMAVIISTTI